MATQLRPAAAQRPLHAKAVTGGEQSDGQGGGPGHNCRQLPRALRRGPHGLLNREESTFVVIGTPNPHRPPLVLQNRVLGRDPVPVQVTEGREQTGHPDSALGLPLALGLIVKEQVVQVPPGSDRPALLPRT